MLLLEFPILDPLRKYLLMMEWVVVFFCLELGLIFLFKYKRTIKKSIRNNQELSYAVLFFAYGIQWFWFIISDYYAPNTEVRTIFLTMGYFTVLIGALIFVFMIEIQKKYVFKYFFTILFLIVIIIFAGLTFVDSSYSQPVSYFTSPVFITFFFFYVVDLSRKSTMKGTFLRHFLRFSLGFITLAVGFLLTTDFMTSMLGIFSKLLGDLIQIISVGFIYLFFTTLPPLSEFDWYNKIDSLYILNRAGISIFSKNFRGNKKSLNEQLIASGLASINIIIENITKSKGISIIKKQNFTVIIYPGKQIAGILFCTEELNSLKELLQRFVEKTDSVYRSVLKHWDGELNIFKPIEEICNTTFKKI